MKRIPGKQKKNKKKGYPSLTFESVSELLLKIIKNIKSNPEEKKFQKINTKATKFYSLIWTESSCKDFLFWMGFKEIEDGYILLEDLKKLDSAIKHLEVNETPSKKGTD
jgi:hypothetical protein